MCIWLSHTTVIIALGIDGAKERTVNDNATLGDHEDKHLACDWVRSR